MARTESKDDILKSNGYAYYFDRMIYYNLEQRKVFTLVWVEDHTEDELNKKIGEVKSQQHEWRFYSNDELPEEIKQAIIKAVD